jgi:hypothetical protein
MRPQEPARQVEHAALRNGKRPQHCDKDMYIISAAEGKRQKKGILEQHKNAYGFIVF